MDFVTHTTGEAAEECSQRLNVIRFPAALIVVFAAVRCYADPIASGYYDQATFRQALKSLERPLQTQNDDFADGTLHIQAALVSSDIDFYGYDQNAGNGHLVAGAYTEYTQKYSLTVWHFAQPVYSFGGIWNLGAVNAGLEIDAGGQHYFLPDGLVPARSLYSWNDSWSGFWGFVSSVPVNDVIIRSGDEGWADSFGQTYELSGLEVSTATPEPGGLLLAVLGIGLMIWPPGANWLCRRRSAAAPGAVASVLASAAASGHTSASDRRSEPL
jgi:hypothetical protein